MRGNSSSADFFLDGVRDDVQYYRDLYNLDRVEALEGPERAGLRPRRRRRSDQPRHQGGRSSSRSRDVHLQGGSIDNRRVTADVDRR